MPRDSNWNTAVVLTLRKMPNAAWSSSGSASRSIAACGSSIFT